MSAPRKEIAAELVAEGRRLYEQTLIPTQEIAARMGISRATLSARIAEWQWTRRGYSSGGPAAPASASEADIPAVADLPALAAQPQGRAAFAAHVRSVLQSELAAAQRVLKMLGTAKQAEAERTARILATVTRTVKEIVATANPNEMTAPDAADDDSVPCDIDELRRELARRIYGIIEARRREAGAGGDGVSA